MVGLYWIYSVLHGGYAAVHLWLCRNLRLQTSPAEKTKGNLPKTFCWFYFILGGLVLDNLTRAGTSLLFGLNSAPSSILSRLFHEMTVVSFFLHNTCLSFLILCLPPALMKLFNPALWWKRHMLTGICQVIGWSFFGWGLYSFSFEEQPWLNLKVTYPLDVPVYAFTRTLGSPVPPSLKILLTGCLSWQVIAFMAALQKGKWRPFLYLLAALCLVGMVTPLNGVEDKQWTYWDGVRLLFSNGMEVLYMLSLWGAIQQLFSGTGDLNKNVQQEGHESLMRGAENDQSDTSLL